MPNLDDNIEDLEPSTGSDLDDKAPASASADSAAEPAASSPATGEEDSDLLSVVRDVVSKREPSASASPAEGVENQVSDEQAPKKQDDEDFSDVPFHKHPRFKQLLNQRNEFKQDAGRYQNVVGFLDNAGLTAEEAADALTVAGLAKTDPAAAWEQMKPWVQKVLQAAGEVIPDELLQRVNAGEMTREAAQELTRATARANSMHAAQSFREQQNERRQQTAAVQAVQGAAVDWEANRRAKDPNYDTKTTAVMKEVLYLQQQEGRPNTPQGVIDQLNKAYKAVNDSLRPAPVQQTRQPVRPVTGGKVAGNQQPEIRGTMDVVQSVLARRRAS